MFTKLLILPHIYSISLLTGCLKFRPRCDVYLIVVVVAAMERQRGALVGCENKATSRCGGNSCAPRHPRVGGGTTAWPAVGRPS